MTKYGIVECSNADVVKALRIKDGNVANKIQAGLLAQYTATGEIEVGTATGNIAGVVNGVDTFDNLTALCHDVVLHGVSVACQLVAGESYDVGAFAYAGAGGKVSATGTIVVGTFSAPKQGNIAFIESL